MCVPNLVQIASGIPKLLWNIHKQQHTSIYGCIYLENWKSSRVLIVIHEYINLPPPPKITNSILNFILDILFIPCQPNADWDSFWTQECQWPRTLWFRHYFGRCLNCYFPCRALSFSNIGLLMMGLNDTRDHYSSQRPHKLNFILLSVLFFFCYYFSHAIPFPVNPQRC